MKSEEKSIQAISAQAHGEAADNRLLRKKLRAYEQKTADLEAENSDLHHKLSEKVDQIADMMQKMVSFMMGEGNVSLSDSLRDAVVAGVRAEFEAREQKLKETYAQEIEKITSDFKAQLAAKQNEINALKGIDDGDAPTTTMPGSSSESGMSTEAKLKASEQQNANLRVTSFGQHTESEKYRWIFCYLAPTLGLTQFVFHDRGRRTQEAVKKYFEDVMDKLYLHSDGAPIYKCYDVGELIQRIACLVHMRRPFYKLKDVSEDAM